MKKRSLSMLLAMGLVLSALVGALGTASAEHDSDVAIEGDASSAHAYFPWVANGSEIDGTGPHYGTITLQNLESTPSVLEIYVADDDEDVDGGYALTETIVLQANGSITLSADQLGVPEPGGSVKVNGWGDMGSAAGDGAENACVVWPEDEDEDVEVYFPPMVNEALCNAIDDLDNASAEWVDIEDLDDIDGIDEDDPAEYARIAGVYKQVSPTASGNAQTSGDHDIVDGYTGLTGDQVSTENVLPIVQTNNEWNTHLRVANLGSGDGLTPYTVTIYEAGGQGAAGASAGSFTGSLRPGEVATHDLLDHADIDEGFVGSAYITSNDPVAAVAERVKAETDMLITNVSRPMGQDTNTQVAPLVFQDWNFWNTGIPVANTGDGDTTVTFNYYPPLSGFTQDQRNIPERGMEYVYRPGGQELAVGALGAAILDGTTSHHSVVDEVKYFGDLPDAGHAMGYNSVPWEDLATAEGLESGDVLALPLFQKGAAEAGDTSGIQLFNADADNSVTAHIEIYDTTGNLVAPTLDTPISQTLSAHSSYTLYAHDLAELPAGFQGSVKIQVSGDGNLGAISNNVNYAVGGDGSAAYNLVKVPGVEPAAPDQLNVDPAEADNEVYAWNPELFAFVEDPEDPEAPIDPNDEATLALLGVDVDDLDDDLILVDEGSVEALLYLIALQVGEVDEIELGDPIDETLLTEAQLQIIADFEAETGVDLLALDNEFGEVDTLVTWLLLIEGDIELDLDAFLAGLTEEERAELVQIIEIYTGINLDEVDLADLDDVLHAVNAWVVDEDGVTVDDYDFDFEVQLVDEFGTPQVALDDEDLEVVVEDGVATLTYSGQDVLNLVYDIDDETGELVAVEDYDSDLILVTANEIDGELVLTGEATKTWTVTVGEIPEETSPEMDIFN